MIPATTAAKPTADHKTRAVKEASCANDIATHTETEGDLRCNDGC